MRGELRNPTLDGIVITIPEIRMSPDLKLAEILVMPLGGGKKEIVLSTLTANRKRLRGLVAKRINLKYMPDFRFHLDDSFDKAGNIDALLNSPRVKRDLENPVSEEGRSSEEVDEQ